MPAHSHLQLMSLLNRWNCVSLLVGVPLLTVPAPLHLWSHGYMWPALPAHPTPLLPHTTDRSPD